MILIQQYPRWVRLGRLGLVYLESNPWRIGGTCNLALTFTEITGILWCGIWLRDTIQTLRWLSSSSCGGLNT